jgi:hypothetical protein
MPKFENHIIELKVLLIGIAIVLSTQSYGQKREVGGGIGAMFYTGDLARNIVFSNIRPSGTVFLRNNITDHTSIRLSFTGGLLQGNDRKPIDAFATARDADFSIFISEFAGSMEYYFLDFKSKRSVVSWSPYFHAGVAVFGMTGQKNKNATYSNVQVAIPFGFGFRYQMDQRWSFALEYGVRATFFDYLDNISDGDIYLKNYQYGNKFNNDQYHVLGVTVSYTFYKVVCPTLPLKQGYRR